jgi:hypothetical protein
MLLRTWKVRCLYFVICVIEDLEGWLPYTLLSMLLRTWRVSCPIFCYQYYKELGGLVVV